MAISLQQIARVLNGEIRGNQVAAPGPGHSAADRSLSVKINDSGDDIVVHSFAGDDPIECKKYVREKCGIQFKPNGRRTSDDIAKFLHEAVQSQRQEKPKGKIVATYPYTDANGTLLYEVLRFEPKRFGHRQPDGHSGWIYKGTHRRVLYRLPDLLKFPDATIFICEGERDADRVASLDHVATTVASGKWTDDCVEPLIGRHVLILEDNDEAGRKKAQEAAKLLYGVADTVRVVRLPGLAEGGDVSDWLDRDPSRASKLADICFDAPIWSLDAEAKEASKENLSSSKISMPFINIAGWRDRPVPERTWTVKDRIPGSNVTLLSGEGSVGKSILSLHLATAVVLGRDWLRSLPEPGPALVVCCEDDTDELWRRFDLIFKFYGAAYTDFKDLHVSALAGKETLMAVPDRKGLMQATELFERTREAACDIKPKLIVLDNSADIFGGNENDRAQVRQFIGLLRGMAMAAGAGVLLTSHPSLTGISTGTGLSGSTAWNASVRSRLYFKRATTDKDEEPDPDLRVLEVMKANYGPVGETITLRWTNGLFLPVGGVSNLEKLVAERRGEELFLKLLEQFTRQRRNTCEKPNAPTYAPTLFAKETEARELGIRKIDLEAAMRRLFATDKIYLEPYGPPSKATSKLVIK